jgi:eukaryotic-like serine/threonine-protein kinase
MQPGDEPTRRMPAGPTLQEELARGTFDGAEVTRIGLELAQALAVMHERGRVHGDLTSSNVLLEPNGRVRLADTGTSRPDDPPADVHALALVLLEALTGRVPETVPPAVPSDTPSPLREALHAMTVTDPDRRPSAREVAGLLAGPAEPADLGNSKGGALVAIGVAALLALMIGVVFATGSAGRDSPVAAPATSAPTSDAPAPPTPARRTPAARTTAPGIALPSIPTALPDLPTALPDLPTALPTALPTIPPDVQKDAESLWDRIRQWWSSLF